MTKVILASGSAIRRQLLEATGLDFAQRAAEIDERAHEKRLLESGAALEELPVELAAAKAQAVSRDDRETLVIGADQILAVDGQALGKAGSLEEARQRLWDLREREHQLHCGAALARDGVVVWRHKAVTRITLRPFSEAFLDEYLAAVGPSVLASVCCYEIEGRGAQLIERLEGDYFSALGLPLLPLLEALRTEGALPR